jgi:ABC-type phosphate/phosphonate transport system substrate-binding protein
MIANARMYSVSPVVAQLWRSLLAAVIETAGVPVTLVEHAPPAPMEQLWGRPDQAAVFMCGLPFSRAEPQPLLVAAPVPAAEAYADMPQYWSELVVRADSPYRSVTDTFGARIAFTVPESQSGYAAALGYFTTLPHPLPAFSAIVAPTITPLGALTAVIRGDADVAPVDSYAFELLRRFEPALTSQVRIIGRTPPTPIPILVASRGEFAAHGGVQTLQSAFLEAHKKASIKALMDELLLRRFAAPDAAAYAILRERREAAMRYWHSHPLAAVTHPTFAP